MAITYSPGTQLGPDDLHMYFRDQYNNLFDPNTLTFSIYFLGNFPPCLVPPADQVATKLAPGSYYANWCVPYGIALGPYEIRWTWTVLPNDTPTQRRVPFSVVQFGDCLPPSTDGF